MLSNYAEHFYKYVERNSNSLELIYTGVCDMKSISSRGGKTYLVTFIDNCIRNDYVYLYNGKDEAIKTSRQYNIEVEYQLEKR